MNLNHFMRGEDEERTPNLELNLNWTEFKNTHRTVHLLSLTRQDCKRCLKGRVLSDNVL